MTKYTKEQRQQIIEAFAKAHNGWFDPHAFLREVEKSGPEHPAYDWFEWDDSAAAERWRLDQSRDFARGLKVRFEVRVEERGTFKVLSREAPLLISPVERRAAGGGYMPMDPDDPEHIAVLAREAARDLAWFQRRYGVALTAAAADVEGLQALQARLESLDSRALAIEAA